MEAGQKTRGRLILFLHFLYLGFFIGLFFNFRAVASIAIASILLTGIFGVITNKISLIPNRSVNFLIAACTLFFLLQLIAIAYTKNVAVGWEHVRLKSGLVIIPLAVFFTADYITKNSKHLLIFYCCTLAIASVYCLVVAITRYPVQHDDQVFFYHKLVSPYSHHAVYFSFFVLVAIVLLMEDADKKAKVFSKAIQWGLVIFFSIFLIMLSSKLLIMAYLFFMGFILLYRFRWHKRLGPVEVISTLIIFLATTFFLLFSKNQVSNRFREVGGTDIHVIEKTKFSPSDYFNGVELRWLEWKFSFELLNEKDRWLIGLTPGETQEALNKKYISRNMYVGDPARHDSGYLGYNTHNQFLESLLQNGIIGAVVFLYFVFGLILMCFNRKHYTFTTLILTLILYTLLESVWETQYGIVLSVFFPVFLFYKKAGS